MTKYEIELIMAKFVVVLLKLELLHYGDEVDSLYPEMLNREWK